MTRVRYISLTVLFDLLAQIVAWYAFYMVKFEWQWLDTSTTVAPAMVFIPALILGVYWVVLFAIFGLYKNLYLISRLDEILRVSKITIIGTLILFFFLFIDQLNWNAGNIGNAKYFAITYWVLVLISTSFFRIFIRSVQKRQAKKGIGLHRAIIIGTGKNAIEVEANLNRNRILGLDVIGYVKTGLEPEKECSEIEKPILGDIKEIKNIVLENQVDDVIVALEQEESRKLIQIMDQIDMPNVSVKILPDFYQMIIGLNQTNQIFGLPLIDVLPDPMPMWEKVAKRLVDILASLILLIIASPVMLFLLVLIPLTSKGGAIYSQIRVGLFGKNFTIYKFRTMVADAEKVSGPQLASQNDPRITPLGNFMRKTRLDELPQLWNVLKGDMSLVGPRPERPFFVDQFKKQIPLYSRRLRVRPGITGWAQVKWKYDESFDDVVEKTKYDLFYVENMSLRMDLKILINTIATVILGKGQ
ncbi:sugar transferase [bacterium]|nr:MAG: sugar transferase [bacterium]